MQFKPSGGSVPIRPQRTPTTERRMFDPTRPRAQDLIPAVEIDPQGGLVKTWSASSLRKFEQCPYAIYLGRVEKIPEVSGPAADRGTRIHDLAEQYIRGEIEELPKELKKFESRFRDVRAAFEEGRVQCEENWGFTIDWEPCEWVGPTTWCRMKLDCIEFESPTSAIARDWKTGRKFGNEIVHRQQEMIYAIGTFMRYPNLEFLRTEFWYLDHAEDTQGTYTRAEAMALMPRLKHRAIQMTSAIEFPAKPSVHNCRWCSYREEHCEWGVSG